MALEKPGKLPRIFSPALWPPWRGLLSFIYSVTTVGCYSSPIPPPVSLNVRCSAVLKCQSRQSPRICKMKMLMCAELMIVLAY